VGLFPGTHVSVMAPSSHPAVDAADAALRSGNQGGASVHDRLATTIASHNLTVDSDTDGDTQHSVRQTDSKLFGVGIFQGASVALPVHCDLPVLISGEGDPGDAARVVVGVNAAEGHHAALLRVSAEGSENPLKKVLEISRRISIGRRQSFGPYELRYTEKMSWLIRSSVIMLSKTGVAPDADRRGYARPRMPSACMYCMKGASDWLMPKIWFVTANPPT